MPQHRAGWTRADDDMIIMFWGREPTSALAARLGRTHLSVKARGIRLGLRPPRAYVRTLRAACRELGYTRQRVLRAIRETGLRPQRLGSYEPSSLAQQLAARRIAPPKGRKRGPRVALGQAPIVLTDNDFEILRAHLAAGPDDLRRQPSPMRRDARAWGRYGRPPACRGCGLAEHPYKQRDICRACWDAARYERQSARARLLRTLHAAAVAPLLALRAALDARFFCAPGAAPLGGSLCAARARRRPPRPDARCAPLATCFLPAVCAPVRTRGRVRAACRLPRRAPVAPARAA